MRDKRYYQNETSTQTSNWLLAEDEDKIEKKHHHHHHHHHHHKKQKRKKKEKPWEKLHPTQKAVRVGGVVSRIVLLFVILYFFICSLGLLEDAFKMLGGRAAGEAFQNSDLLSNPIAGLMIGVLATVLVQSSSTATSIVVAMVASQVIPLRTAIPIIMGTNIGTSVTSTLVSLAQAGEREEFRRAFAGATVHDMFNWSAVLVLLPLEMVSGYLYHLTGAIVDSMNLKAENYKFEMLTAITRPFTELIVEVNKGVITDIAMAPNATGTSSVLKRWCKVNVVTERVSVMHYTPVECSGITPHSPLYQACTQQGLQSFHMQGYDVFVGKNDTEIVNTTIDKTRCSNLFAQSDLSDKAAGVILLILSIAVILTSLFGIVKVLNAMLQGPVAKLIHKSVNSDFPGRWAWLTGYVALLMGCGLTIIIQSSSVFTSTLTPLVGVGIITVERMYPMALGSNIGTTVTGILAAMSTKGGHLAEALQIALCHLFFNISAVMLFFPVPVMRFPISMAKVLGKVTSKYRWFAVFYLLMMFLVLPSVVFGLSFAGWGYLALIMGPAFLIFLFAIIVNVLQVKRPEILPPKLKNWDFLPLFLHSCRPYDRFASCAYCKEKCPKLVHSDSDYSSDSGEELCTIKSHQMLVSKYGAEFGIYDDKKDGLKDKSMEFENRTFKARSNHNEKGDHTDTHDSYKPHSPRNGSSEERNENKGYKSSSPGRDAKRFYTEGEPRRSRPSEERNSKTESNRTSSDQVHSPQRNHYRKNDDNGSSSRPSSVSAHRKSWNEPHRAERPWSSPSERDSDISDNRRPYVRNRRSRSRSRAEEYPSRDVGRDESPPSGRIHRDRRPRDDARESRDRRSEEFDRNLSPIAHGEPQMANDNRRPYVRNRRRPRSKSRSQDRLDDDFIDGPHERGLEERPRSSASPRHGTERRDKTPEYKTKTAREIDRGRETPRDKPFTFQNRGDKDNINRYSGSSSGPVSSRSRSGSNSSFAESSPVAERSGSNARKAGIESEC